MAFVGGSADKIGGEYEVWWTLRRVTQLLRGQVDAIAVEPLGGDGAELWVEAGAVRTYDQVKFRSRGRWTPARLRSDGVLAKLGRHYAAGAEVLLVLSQPSEELERLIALARATSTGVELWVAATTSNDLDLLRDAWGVSKEETRAYLLQTSVRHDGLPHLKEFVDLAMETLVLGNANFAIGVLREFLDREVTTRFTAPQVWAALEANGLHPRPRLEPGPTVTRLREALDRHVRAVQRSAPEAGTIPRREVMDIVKSITESNTPILLVVGKAGAGKSVVVSDAAQELARQGRHVAALRLDRLDPSTSSAARLGMAMEIERSPILALSEVSPTGFDGVLVIDQLDAVSNYSGRMPTVYEAVDEALTQARLLGNVRVILAVRSIDLQEDPRLRKLAGEDVPTITVGELDAQDVRNYLAQIGADVSALNATTLQLLRLPIHLYVFSELEPTMRTASYGTLSALYGAFTRSFRARLEREGHPDEWPEVSRVVVERMNADEALAIPAAVLEHVRPLYLEALISANVIVEEDRRLALFHETYFDYLFAKSFAHRGQDLVGWFATSGQGLFRRSQLRQLLAYIATEERSRFIDQVLAIADSSLRPHLVSIAYTALAGFAPTPADWTAVRRLATSANPFGVRAMNLISGPKWFAAADATGDVEILLDDPKWQDVVAGLVGRLAGDMPERVLELLRPRQAHGEVWVRALRSALEVTDSAAWADFALEQMSTDGLDLPDTPFHIVDTRLFQRISEPRPADALRLLKVALTRDVDMAIAEQVDDLQGALSRWGHHSVDAGELEHLALSVGSEFVDELLPLIEKIAMYKAPGGRQMWRYRIDDKHRNFDDDLFFAFDDALTKITRDDPDRASPLLERLSLHHIGALDFLVCRALNEAPSDRAVDWLLETEEHRSLGWMSSARWETRQLVERASQACSDERFAALESVILFWWPAYVSPAIALQRSGWAELELLSALAHHRLSEIGRRRLAELHRKFPQWAPSEPEGISGGFVQSPIAHDAAERMNDGHWLRAMEKYVSRDRRTFRDGGAFGGTDELANMMGTLAKADPARFLSFALSFPASIPASYTDHVIRSVAGEVSQLELLPLLMKFRTDHPADSGRAVVSAIASYGGELADDLFETLLLLADDADPTQEFARTETSSGYYFGGDFVSAGINSARGLVASTLARVLFADNSRLRASLSSLERLAADPFIAVRTMTTEPALAYASMARDDGLEMIERLLDDEFVLSTSPGTRALRWAMLWDTERFAPYLSRALAAEDPKLAGSVWANCFVNDALGSAPVNVNELSESARIGVAEAITPDPGLAVDLLASLFSDPSREVRREAARSLHFLSDMALEPRDDLIAQFIESTAFADSVSELLDALEELSGELPSTALEVCRRGLDAIADATPRAIGALTGNLVAVLVRIYRASNEAGREAALDLIDRTVHLQLWNVDDSLDDAR